MSRLRRIVLGFGVALLAVGGFLYAVGPAAVLAELSDADLVVLSVGFGSVVVALSCWSEAVRRLIASTGHETGGLRYRGAYLSGEFLKQVLPMGQSGGPVLMAYTVSREADTPSRWPASRSWSQPGVDRRARYSGRRSSPCL